jgi:hypothetical protein
MAIIGNEVKLIKLSNLAGKISLKFINEWRRGKLNTEQQRKYIEWRGDKTIISGKKSMAFTFFPEHHSQ